MNSREEAEPRGSYNSPVRQEQAQLTRQRIATAARSLFLQQGYARTKLRQIAEEAGVSEQTIYAVHRNKRGVLFALIDDMDMRAGVDQTAKDLAAADGDAIRQLEVFISFDRRLFEREREHLLILRDAGSSEPELADAYKQGRERARQTHLQTFSKWDQRGALSPTLTPDMAADLYQAISSLDTFDYLVFERGWSSDDWQAHTLRTLEPALINPAVLDR